MARTRCRATEFVCRYLYRTPPALRRRCGNAQKVMFSSARSVESTQDINRTFSDVDTLGRLFNAREYALYNSILLSYPRLPIQAPKEYASTSSLRTAHLGGPAGATIWPKKEIVPQFLSPELSKGSQTRFYTYEYI